MRAGLQYSGIVPASRNNDGFTTFMVASVNGYDRALGEMIRWYEKRDAELRKCLELTEETGKCLDRVSMPVPVPVPVSVSLGMGLCSKRMAYTCT